MRFVCIFAMVTLDIYHPWFGIEDGDSVFALCLAYLCIATLDLFSIDLFLPTGIRL